MTLPTKAQRGGRAPLYALLAANAISMVGNVLANLAIPWFVLETTGSAAKTGLAAFSAVLPAVLAGFFGGALVDRMGYRRTSAISDLASGASVALIPLLNSLGRLEYWHLLVLVFLGALLDAPGNTARSALLPELAETAGMGLERASGAMQAIQRGSNLIGAPLAGGLIAVIGAESVLWLDAVTFAISAGIIALIVPAPAAMGEAAPGGRYLDDLLEGLRFVLRDRLVLAIVLTVTVTNFLDAPMFSVVLPVYARQTFGRAIELGVMVAAFGGGAALGAVAFGAFGHRLPRRLTFIGSFVLVGLQFWALGLSAPYPFLLGALALSGLAAGPLNPLLQTLSYERVPPGMRGRVFGTMTAAAWIAIPLGVLVAGFALEWLGLRSTLLIVAGLYLATTLSLAVNPAIRGMDRRAGFAGRRRTDDRGRRDSADDRP